MRPIFLTIALMIAAASSLAAQTLDWLDDEEEALLVSRNTDRPILIVTAASQLSQQTDLALGLWPLFTQVLSRTVVPLKIKQAAWIPLETTAPVLALWFPDETQKAVVWKELPSLLEIAQALKIKPPYQIPIKAFRTERSYWQRQGEGPLWSQIVNGEVEPESYKEEGPAGELVILKEVSGEKRVALPLHDGWSFQSDSRTQRWTLLEIGKVE